MDSTKCPFIKESVAKCPFIARHVAQCPHLKDKFDEVAPSDKNLSSFYDEVIKSPVISDAFDKCSFLKSSVADCPFFNKDSRFVRRNEPAMSDIRSSNVDLPPLTAQVNSQGLMVPTIPKN